MVVISPVVLVSATVLAIVCAVCAVNAISGGNGQRAVSKEESRVYALWRMKYGKLESTPAERDFRMRVFLKEYKFVEEANQKYTQWKLAKGEAVSDKPTFEANYFADMTEEEFVKAYTGARVEPDSIESDDQEFESELASAENIVKGLGEDVYVPRLRNQGHCGSCWAFGTIAVAEKHYWNLNRQQVDLAHQELLDCDTYDSGCNGGSTVSGLFYINRNNIALASDYPYVAANGACEKEGKKRVTLKGTMSPRSISFSNSTAHKMASAGTIPSVSLYAAKTFRYLAPTEEVFDASSAGDECQEAINHMIAIIGRGTDHLVVLNSWGDKWGVKGVKKLKPCSPNNFWGSNSILVTAK